MRRAGEQRRDCVDPRMRVLPPTLRQLVVESIDSMCFITHWCCDGLLPRLRAVRYVSALLCYCERHHLHVKLAVRPYLQSLIRRVSDDEECAPRTATHEEYQTWPAPITHTPPMLISEHLFSSLERTQHRLNRTVRDSVATMKDRRCAPISEQRATCKQQEQTQNG